MTDTDRGREKELQAVKWVSEVLKEIQRVSGLEVPEHLSGELRQLDSHQVLDEKKMWPGWRSPGFEPWTQGDVKIQTLVGKFPDFPEGFVWVSLPVWIWRWRYRISRPKDGWRFQGLGPKGCVKYPRVWLSQGSHVSLGKLAFLVDGSITQEELLSEPGTLAFQQWISRLLSLWSLEGEAMLYATSQKLPNPRPVQLEAPMDHTLFCWKDKIGFSNSKSSSYYWRDHQVGDKTLNAVAKYVPKADPSLEDSLKNILSSQVLTGSGLASGTGLGEKVPQGEFGRIIEKWKLKDKAVLELFLQDEGRKGLYEEILNGRVFTMEEISPSTLDSLFAQVDRELQLRRTRGLSPEREGPEVPVSELSRFGGIMPETEGLFRPGSAFTEDPRSYDRLKKLLHIEDDEPRPEGSPNAEPSPGSADAINPLPSDPTPTVQPQETRRELEPGMFEEIPQPLPSTPPMPGQIRTDPLPQK